MEYLAHRSVTDGRNQELSNHLIGVSALAGQFAADFGAEIDGKLCGLLHDIGKYTYAFQRRLFGDNRKTDHSTAGALEAVRLLKDPFIAMCIAGHHSGLLNIGSMKCSSYGDGTFSGRLNAKIGTDIEDFSEYSNEIEINSESIVSKYRDKRSAFFYVHMLYSCLVDADFLDTEAFMTDNKIRCGKNASLYDLSVLLNAYIQPWMSPQSEINKERCKILNSLMAKSSASRGIFTLTVPTGGGKTVASIAFALRHALANTLQNGKPLRRIIYVIPFVSIIEQTQVVFEKIFGKENVIPHYANMDISADDEGIGMTRKLAAENWDAPIILTTAVQFFESLYSNKPSACRKLHNIAGSVLIFDEAQMLPSQYTEPCLFAIAELVKRYSCSAVLCTATRPAFDKILQKMLPEYPIRELCPEPERTYEFFRRVTYVNDGIATTEALADKLRSLKQVLCIVNTKKQARQIFSLINQEGSFHLSTLMTPYHRRKTLDEIRRRLVEGKACLVVSTSLIEAGVDVDFPEVFREYAGLDSMIQAGGRCNREGNHKKEESIVHYFKLECSPPRYIRQNVAAAEHTIQKFEDISSPEAVNEYFSFLLYTLRDEKMRDIKEIMHKIDTHFDFADISAEFKIIGDGEYTIVVPEDAAVQLIEQMRQYGMNRELWRKLGMHTVGVHKDFFVRLISSGKAEIVADNTAILADINMYREDTGLSIEECEMDSLIF